MITRFYTYTSGTGDIYYKMYVCVCEGVEGVCVCVYMYLSSCAGLVCRESLQECCTEH